ncbi:MAG: hypothetical protein ACRBHB_12630 [Arenicella sp.]
MIGSVLKKTLLMANTLLKTIIAIYATNKIAVINLVLQNLKILLKQLNTCLKEGIKIVFNSLITSQSTMKILFVVIALISFSAHGWEKLDKEFSVLNTDMRHMWSGGAWQHEEKEGFYRFLVAGGGYEHYKSKLYVQWLVHGSDMEAPRVIRTIEIKQLNDNPLYAFNLPACGGGWKCNSVELEATHTYELTRHKFKISLTDIGKYEFVASAL